MYTHTYIHTHIHTYIHTHTISTQHHNDERQLQTQPQRFTADTASTQTNRAEIRSRKKGNLIRKHSSRNTKRHPLTRTEQRSRDVDYGHMSTTPTHRENIVNVTVPTKNTTHPGEKRIEDRHRQDNTAKKKKKNTTRALSVKSTATHSIWCARVGHEALRDTHHRTAHTQTHTFSIPHPPRRNTE